MALKVDAVAALCLPRGREEVVYGLRAETDHGYHPPTAETVFMAKKKGYHDPSRHDIYTQATVLRSQAVSHPRMDTRPEV